MDPKWKPSEHRQIVRWTRWPAHGRARSGHWPVITCCALLLSACVQRAPLASVSGACGHLTARPDLYADCARSVQTRNQLRQEAWARAAAESESRAPTPSFSPDPSVYTLHTQPPPPPSPMPSSGLSDIYAVHRSDIRIGSPDGPIVGQTTRIGSPPPPIVLVPVPGN